MKWSNDTDELYNSLSNEEPSVYREVSENILKTIQSFQKNILLSPTGVKEYYGIEDIYTYIQLQFEGGEDLMRD